MMTLLIGNKKSAFCQLKAKHGLTFIEVMITVVILSVGIVAIFKTYIVSLDQMTHITNRIYVSTLLDDRVATIERHLRAYKSLPLDMAQEEYINVGSKQLTFSRDLKISDIEDFVEIFNVDLSISWQEGDRDMKISRSSYISDFRSQ